MQRIDRHPRAHRVLRTFMLVWGCWSVLVCAAGAQTTDYCDKVRARSSSDAAYLIAPKLFGQFLRFPTTTETRPDADLYPELGASGGKNYQLRLGLAFSAVDAYKGIRLGNASDRDCQAHAAKREAQRAIDFAPDAILLRAERAEYAKLKDGGAECQQVLQRSRERFDKKLITRQELQTVEDRVAVIERRRNELSSHIKQMELRGVQELAQHDLSELERQYVDAELEREAALSSIKALSAWDLSVTGGALLPVGRSELDWFGWVELRYSLGGLFSNAHERSYMRAREAELRNADYELPGRRAQLQAQLRVQRELAQQELTLAEKHLAFLDSTLAALATTHTEAVGQVQDNLLLDSLLAHAEQTRLQTRLQALDGLLPGQTSR